MCRKTVNQSINQIRPSKAAGQQIAQSSVYTLQIQTLISLAKT